MHSATLDDIILSALRDLTDFLGAHRWRGRENELVSLFAFGFLLRHACPPLEPTQIGIEVAVPQVPGWSPRHKADVRKDLVLWRYPEMTNWNETPGTPDPILAVLEWKSLNNIGIQERPAQKRGEHQSDVDWLLRSTRAKSRMSGYAVMVDTSAPITVTCRIVRGGSEIGPPNCFRPYPR